jgi:hypothetical protein
MRGYLACDGSTAPIRVKSTATAANGRLTAIAAGFQSAVDAGATTLLEQLSRLCRQ